MSVTHRIDQGVYKLISQGQVVGVLKQTDKGFYGSLVTGEELPEGTMAHIKTVAESLVAAWEGFAGRIKEKQPRITIEEARKMAGLSHGMLNNYIREIKQFHPYVPVHKWGAAIVKMAFELQVKIPGMLTKYEKEWLEARKDQLPEMKEVDWEWYELTRSVKYK